MLLAAGTLGWAVACGGARAANIAAMPLPNAKRSYTKVMIDQGINGAWSTDHHAAGDVILPKDGFIAGVPKGFGIFERWILRLGYFFHRAIGKDVFSGDLAVLIYPSKPVSGNYIDALVSYVNGGGKVLIVESPENDKSTAGSILEQFGLSLRSDVGAGELSIDPGWPKIKVTAAREIAGGMLLIKLTDKPVAAVANKGKGSVTVIGVGSRFSDPQMGVTGDNEPDAELRGVYGLDFELIRSIIENRPMAVPKNPAPATMPTTPLPSIPGPLPPAAQ